MLSSKYEESQKNWEFSCFLQHVFTPLKITWPLKISIDKLAEKSGFNSKFCWPICASKKTHENFNFFTEMFLLKSIMQFWQPCRRNLADSPKNVFLIKSFPKVFFQKCSSWWAECGLELSKCYWSFLLRVRKKLPNLPEFNVFHELSPEKFLFKRKIQYRQPCWNNFAKSLKIRNSCLFFQIFFREVPSGRVEYSWQQLSEEIPVKCRKPFARSKSIYNLLQNYFPSSSARHVECKFEKVGKDFCSKSKTNFQWNSSAVFFKIFSPRSFPSGQKMQVWQPCRSSFGQNATLLAKKAIHEFSSRCFFPNVPRENWNNFWKPGQKNSHSPKINRFWLELLQNFSPNKFPFISRMQFWNFETLPKIFAHCVKKISIRSFRKHWSPEILF